MGMVASPIFIRRLKASSSFSIDTTSISATAPASISRSICINETPVSVSPQAIAVSTGEAPRYFGKIDP